MNPEPDLLTRAGREAALAASAGRLAAACRGLRELAMHPPLDPRPRVLIVEDDPAQPKLYSVLLAQVAVVVVAHDVDQAIAAYAAARPDAMLVDGPGIPWAEQLADPPPCAIVSGWDHSGRSGFAAIRMKPVEASELQELVLSLTAGRPS